MVKNMEDLEYKQRLKYLSWRKEREKQLQERIKTTCIIGAMCEDGILLAGDRRVLRGGMVSEEEKIIRPHELNVLYASSGTTALMDEFLGQVEMLLHSHETGATEIITMDDFKKSLENISFYIYDRYTKRTPQHVLDVFVSYKNAEYPTELYHIHREGITEEVKQFDIIGSGETYVLPFIKSLYYEGISLNDMTWICCYVLGLMNEQQLHYSVGGLPQIVWFKHENKEGDANPVQVDEKEIKKIIKTLKGGNKKLSENIWNVLTFEKEKL